MDQTPTGKTVVFFPLLHGMQGIGMNTLSLSCPDLYRLQNTCYPPSNFSRLQKLRTPGILLPDEEIEALGGTGNED